MSYWDEENSVGASCISFIVGSVLGASIALLYAPQSGEATRQEMREKTERTIIKAHKLEEELKYTISQLIGNVRLKVSQLVEDGKDIHFAITGAVKITYNDKILHEQFPAEFGLNFDGSPDQPGVGKLRYWEEKVTK